MVRTALPPQARYRVRAWTLDTPVLSELLSVSDPVLRAYCRPDAETDLLIDGFPRSANSYAAAAFRLSNPDRNVRSNLHSHRGVLRAAELGVPAVVLIRNPRDAIASALRLNPQVPGRYGIRRYLAFYNGIRDCTGFVLADFDQVVTDFGAVLRRCNSRFGTNFALYENTPSNEAAVQDMLIDWRRQALSYAGFDPALSNPARLNNSDVLGALNERDRTALRQATELYERLIDRAAPGD